MAGSWVAAAGMIATSVFTYAIGVVLYGYLSLTVPALSLEAKNAPGGIGKPLKPTNVLTAFERSFRLVGKQNVLRIGLIWGGLLLICAVIITLVAGGAVLIIALYARAVNADVAQVLSNGWTIFAVISFSVLVAMSVLLALDQGLDRGRVWRVGLPHWRRRRRDAAVEVDPTRAAADYRTLAEEAAQRGDWAGAVGDRFRALVRELEVQTILDVRQARTAWEAACLASRSLPGSTAMLREAAVAR